MSQQQQQQQPQQGIKRGNESAPGGGAKKMRGDTVTLRFLLISKHAGGIIGKGGQTIKRLRSEYSATVNVPDSNCQERVLSIAATQENAVKVLRECLPLFHEPPFPVSAGAQGQKSQFEIDFLVHSSQVGGIIGRAGAKIKELREITGTNIKVFQECLPNSTERVVALGGGEEEIINALQKILELMQEQPIRGNIALYDPSAQGEWNNQGYDNFGPPMGGGGPMGGGNMRGGGGGGSGSGGGGNMRGGMRGGRGGGSGRGGGNFGGPGSGGNFGGPGGYESRGGGSNFGNMSNQNQGQGGYGGDNFSNDNFQNFGDGQSFGMGNSQTTQVTIPNDLAGAIIGKGGERIRSIRTRSGADIKIEDPQPGKTDRVITICGNNDQIQYAQFLMQQSVRQHSGKK